jgi:hypothetical protein
MPWDHDHQKHHDRRRLDRVVGADKINPRYRPPDSSTIDPTMGVNDAVSTHDSDNIWCGGVLLGAPWAQSAPGCAQAEGAI